MGHRAAMDRIHLAVEGEEVDVDVDVDGVAVDVDAGEDSRLRD